ncbi:MAG: CsbD family protein [Methylocystis sp.]|nr:CsbD family protein [Methylocystis sp.]
MDWDNIEGSWKQFTGTIKEKWAKLTDDDLALINGKREQLEGKLQELYGHGKEQAKKEIDDFLGRFKNWDNIEGSWKQFTGTIKEKWAKLTDDDLALINGKRERLEGKLQELYGHDKERAKKEIDDFLRRL